MSKISANKGFYFCIISVLCVSVSGYIVFAYAQENPKKSASQEQGPPAPQMPPPSNMPVSSQDENSPLPPELNPPAQRIITASKAAQFDEDSVKGMEVKKGRISLDLKGIDVNELFRILSLKMGVTIVPSKGVGGRVNIFLNNLTLQDAFDIILLSQDLAADRKGDIINVMTSPEYERLYGKKYNEKRKFKNLKLNYAKPSVVFTALGQLKSDIGRIIVDEASGNIFLIDIPEKLDLMERTVKDMDKPPEVKVFDLNYAKSSDMKTHLASAITPGSGELFVDEKSGKVVVSDLPGKMKKIERIVKAFDAEPLQVFIEAEILQITLNDQFQRGINWDRILSDVNKKKLGLTNGRAGIAPKVFELLGSFLPGSTVTSTALQKVVFGTMATDNYTIVIQYLQTYGDTKILSRPRIAAVNNQEAKILVGTRQAYVSQTLSQAQTTTVTSESVQFVDVGVKLNVVPTINKEGFITMKIKPEVSSVTTTLTTSLGSIIPIVETAEAETVVKVKDGSMILIAGLMKDEKTDDTKGVPVLSKIPILGWVFGNRSVQKKRTEIVIFLTPHIITGDNALSGTEPEKYITTDVVPPRTQDYIISKDIEGINTKPLAGSEEREMESIISPATKVKSEMNIQDKMKGLKGL